MKDNIFTYLYEKYNSNDYHYKYFRYSNAFSCLLCFRYIPKGNLTTHLYNCNPRINKEFQQFSKRLRLNERVKANEYCLSKSQDIETKDIIENE